MFKRTCKNNYNCPSDMCLSDITTSSSISLVICPRNLFVSQKDWNLPSIPVIWLNKKNYILLISVFTTPLDDCFCVLISPLWNFGLISVQCKVPTIHHHRLDLLLCYSQLYRTFLQISSKEIKNCFFFFGRWYFSLMVDGQLFFHPF